MFFYVWRICRRDSVPSAYNPMDLLRAKVIGWSVFAAVGHDPVLDTGNIASPSERFREIHRIVGGRLPDITIGTRFSEPFNDMQFSTMLQTEGVQPGLVVHAHRIHDKRIR